MNKYNIDHNVMLCLSQLYCNGWKKQDCIDGIKFQNDFNASVQKEIQKNLPVGLLCNPFILIALNEMERCVNELGLKLLCLPTHF